MYFIFCPASLAERAGPGYVSAPLLTSFILPGEVRHTHSGNGIALNTKGLAGWTCGKKKFTQVCKCVCARGVLLPNPLQPLPRRTYTGELESPIPCFWRLFSWMTIAAAMQEEYVKKRSSLAYSSPVIDYSHKSRQFNALKNQPSNVSNDAIRRVNSKHG